MYVVHVRHFTMHVDRVSCGSTRLLNCEISGMLDVIAAIRLARTADALAILNCDRVVTHGHTQ